MAEKATSARRETMTKNKLVSFADEMRATNASTFDSQHFTHFLVPLKLHLASPFPAIICSHSVPHLWLLSHSVTF